MKRLLLLLSIGGFVARRLGPERRAALMRDLSSRFRELTSGRTARSNRPVAGSPDDATLAHKVETVLFRPDDVPKGKINVNVEYGKVVLRGEADSQEMIDDLVRRATEIEGVERVESLLHLPGEPAPMHE
jgi:osmotically-inducible protein OsmY